MEKEGKKHLNEEEIHKHQKMKLEESRVSDLHKDKYCKSIVWKEKGTNIVVKRLHILENCTCLYLLRNVTLKIYFKHEEKSRKMEITKIL